MRNFLVLFIIVSFSISNTHAQPKREHRGAWIATYSNIDYPVRGQSPAEQRAHFISLLDLHKSTGINAVYVQVRSQADAFYPSAIEPWSADLTGVQGMAPDPYWDPLEFMITETHKRGMEFHAWLNPYRVAGNTANISTFSQGHVYRKHPEWLLRYGTLITLNPGLPEVKNYILSVVKDITQRYDVDGIHFDDYFYPDPAVNDNAAFRDYGKNFSNKADWRRNNVNELIESVYNTITKMKPWVKFGVSPSGIYRNSNNFSEGTPTTGLQHYSELFADSRKWLEEGWVDYIEPQVYWSTKQNGSKYGDIVPWWNSIANGRHIYIGMAGYKVEHRGHFGWSDPAEFSNQLRINRYPGYKSIKGQSVYNSTSLVQNPLGIRDTIKRYFSRPSLQPEMKWKDSIAPASPLSLWITSHPGGIHNLTWTLPEGKAGDNWRVVIYRSALPEIDFNHAENILAIIPATGVYQDRNADPGATYYYAVTALDRLHNESLPSNIATPGNYEIPFSLVDFILEQRNQKEVVLSWKAINESGIEKYELEKSISNAPFSVIASVVPGRSAGMLSYELDDTLGVQDQLITYRLRISDSTGKITYSKSLSVSSKTQPVIVSVPVTPLPEKMVADTSGIRLIEPPSRPFRKGSNISLTILSLGEVGYEVFDISKKKITWGKIRNQKKGTRIGIPGTANLEPGDYRFVIKHDEGEQNVIVKIL